MKPTAGTSIPLYEESIVLKLEGNAGHIEGFNGKDVPLQDRFFKGADSFRGFAQSGVGPRQIGNDGDTDAIGAQSYAIATAELTFPVGLPEQWGIEGAAFTDFGTVFGTPEETSADWRPILAIHCGTALHRLRHHGLPRLGRCRSHLAVALRPAAFRTGLSSHESQV